MADLTQLLKCFVDVSHKHPGHSTHRDTESIITTISSIIIINTLTLYQPMTRICIMDILSSISIYMGVLVLGVNTFIWFSASLGHLYIDSYGR